MDSGVCGGKTSWRWHAQTRSEDALLRLGRVLSQAQAQGVARREVVRSEALCKFDGVARVENLTGLHPSFNSDTVGGWVCAAPQVRSHPTLFVCDATFIS